TARSGLIAAVIFLVGALVGVILYHFLADYRSDLLAIKADVTAKQVEIAAVQAKIAADEEAIRQEIAAGHADAAKFYSVATHLISSIRRSDERRRAVQPGARR